MPVSDLTAQLPFQGYQNQANAFSGYGGNPSAAAANLGPAYASNFNTSANLNNAILQGTQTGYQNLRGQLDQQYGDIYGKFQNLYGDVLGRIAGTNQTNMQDINTAYNAQAGNTTQSLISRGLGNSTVLDSMQRGVEADRQRALTASQNQFTQLGAGYASAIGGQGLQSQQQGAQTQANLGSQQLQFLGSTQAPYPNAGMYSQMAQMYGAQQEADKNRQQAASLMRPPTGFAQGGMGVGSGSGNNTPFKGPPPGFGSSLMSGNTGGYGGFGSFGGYGQQQTYTPDPNLGFSGGNYQAPENPGAQYGYSDPQAMAAIGGGAIGAMGWGGYGSPMGGGGTSYYDAGAGAMVDPFQGY